MKHPEPPRWANRLLTWYCHPDYLEEVQGDLLELHRERVHTLGKRKADFWYAFDVMRFFRWSTIRGEKDRFPRFIGPWWGLNIKVAVRNALRNKLIFAIKSIGLAVCIAFTLLLAAFLVHEVTYDQHHDRHEQIYRITSRVSFQDHVTHYAVTPLPLGETMVRGIPDVERFSRMIYEGKPVFRVGENQFYNESTLAADSNFLRMLTFDYINGNVGALDRPNQIVITESTAQRFFGTEQAMGRFVQYGEGPQLEVTGVLSDPPDNSHLQFDALISWSTFGRDDSWANLNAYTYILLKPGARITDVQSKMPALLKTFHELVAREYKATYEPVFENITSIHLSEPLDEDIAARNSANNVPVLAVVALLFMITGLVNYLNLSLAEITASVRKLGIIRIFGGIHGNHYRVLLAEGVTALSFAVPLIIILFLSGLNFGRRELGIEIGAETIQHPLFIVSSLSLLSLSLASSWFNALVLSRACQVTQSLKGKLTARLGGITIRKFLVGTQVALSVTMMALMMLIVDQFRFIQTTDKGFDDSNTIVVKMRSGDPQEIESFMEQLRSTPGVTAVEGSSYYPGVIETKYVFEVEEATGMQERLVPMMLCGYQYFETLRMRTMMGRPFSPEHPSDIDAAFVVNETAVREFGWEQPLGKRIRGPVGGDGSVFREGKVIGVLQNFNFDSFHARIQPMIIMLNDERWYGSQFIYVKTEPMAADHAVAAIEELYKSRWDSPFDYEYLDVKYQSLYHKDLVTKLILQIGLIISIALCGLGIFSLSALLAHLRTKETGIRKVVGATFSQLISMHTRTFYPFLVLGVPAAWICFLLLSRWWLATFAYHVTVDFRHFLFPAMLATLVVALTSGFHAIRGALMNPADCLRHE